MTTLTATHAREKWFEMLRKSVKGHQVYQINSREGEAVLLSKADYDNLMETLELAAIPGLVKSVKTAEQEIKSGKSYAWDEVFHD
ncbi:MAG: type II toxin-antitoxin system prevent-host-death family antitoxin [Candidatus Omnitrophica bacterium]|nr:type II toxin-antitoxin system prevent-host-death family antitoxin [Candidatus Omnitrophota bacterium]